PEHRDLLFRLIDVLRRRYATRDDVYISGNMMMYYVEGNSHLSFSSDVFVTFGIPKQTRRRVYKTWEDGPPTIAFELTSLASRRIDLRDKRDLYQMLGVQEYVVFDPLEEYLDPRLQGFRLVDGIYLPMPRIEQEALVSSTLGVILRPDGEQLR